MPETARWIGGFVRWLFKGCKTKLRDEIEGNLEPTWGGTYDFENYIIGLVTVVVILGVIFFLVF
ncbi:MAG: hypothetical protein Q4G63_07910 [Bacteroidia bacterium]|nr:hypothetical protein [Bacteroidia bacterium]